MPGQYTCVRCSKPFAAWPSNRRQFCGRECGRAPKCPSSEALITQADGAVGIPLYANDGSVKAYVIVDAADSEWANQWRWCLDGDGYAIRNRLIEEGPRGRVYLHRDMLGLVSGDGMEGDHWDRDRLNCRRKNLRGIPKAGNRQNVPGRVGTSSRHRGVAWYKARNKWVAYVTVTGKHHHLGYFAKEDAAAEAARAARARLMPFSTD